MIDSLLHAFTTSNLPLTDEEFADVLWLASYMDMPSNVSMLASAPEVKSPPATPADAQNHPQQPTKDQEAASTSSQPPASAQAEVHLPKPSIHDKQRVEGMRALSFRSPAATALPGKLALARALRPILRKIPSSTQLELDEVATAEQAAEEGRLTPQLRPGHERWLDVAVVIDDWHTMAIWQQTIAEFIELLQQLGAFRTLQTYLVHTKGDGQTEQATLQLFTAQGFKRGRICLPGELVDPRGRRLTLVLTDCTSPAWSSGAAGNLLSQWGSHNMVTLVQMLPADLWNSCELADAIQIAVSAPVPGIHNAKLAVERPWYWDDIWDEDRKPTMLSQPMPIITLEPEPLRRWTQTMVSKGGSKTAAFYLSLQSLPSFSLNRQVTSEILSPEERWRRFRATASPIAQELVGYLSAAPLNLPVMRLVQQVMLPQSRQVHLAEILRSNLIYTLPTSDAIITPDETQYEFVEGIRKLLLTTMLLNDSKKVLETVSEYISRHSEPLRQFHALILDPTSPGNFEGHEKTLPFAHIAVQVLLRLGGEHALLAERLKRHIDYDDSGTIIRYRSTEYIEPQIDIQSTPVDSLPLADSTKSFNELIGYYLSPNSEAPFYTQTSLLDRYLRVDVATENTQDIDLILETIKIKEDLRKYFFQSTPHFSWAKKLWEQGFFTFPPPPQVDAKGQQWLTKWDAQTYLLAIAKDAPDIVINHVEAIEGDGWYISRAIDILCEISPVQATKLLPRVLQWIQDPNIAERIDNAVYQLLLHFAQAKLEEPTFALFKAITTPIDPGASTLKVYRESIKPRIDYYNLFSQELSLLREINPVRLVQTLEQQVHIVAMQLTNRNSERPYSSFWRSAIEDTDQDVNDDFKNKLIVSLRNELEYLTQNYPTDTERIISNYLQSEQSIFVRLAIHLLTTFPTIFPKLTAAQLLNTKNIDELTIHHEFFNLLRKGYRVLTTTEQKILVLRIRSGFSTEQKAVTMQWLKQLNKEEVEQELAAIEKCWVRDRLWMIREELTRDDSLYLNALVAELGEPTHPEFTSWHGPVEWSRIQDRSPLSKEQIAEMIPDELVQTIQTWLPPKGVHPFRRDTLQGLAETVATVLVANPIRYAEHINRVTSLGAIFAREIIDHFTSENNSPQISWEFCLDLIEKLLYDQPVMFKEDLDEVSFTSVRLSMLRLIERSFHKSTLLPIELYLRVQAILLELLKDPDPDSYNDNTPEDASHYDPLTRSLNHVRPVALSLLINLQVAKVKHASQDSTILATPNREIKGEIANALTKRLDPKIEPSPSVRAVFGRHLLSLYELDREWTEIHLDEIFPEEENLESVNLFRAAFETFLVTYYYCQYTELRKALRPKYTVSIQRLDPQTQRRHPDPIQGLATHIVADYLLGGYDFADPISQTNLLGMFFSIDDADIRKQAAWAAWRFCSERPEQFWPKIKLLWRQRLNTVNGTDKPSDFQQEFCHYIQLLPIAGMLEPFTSLWDLIIASLPYALSTYQTFSAWEELEKFLEQQVSQEPVLTVTLYRMMRDYVDDPYRFQPSESRRKILTIAAENEQSRRATCSLIDSIARLGVYGYKDIYERFYNAGMTQIDRGQLIESLRHSDSIVRWNAAAQLIAIANEQDWGALQTAFQTETESTLRGFLYEQLAKNSTNRSFLINEHAMQFIRAIEATPEQRFQSLREVENLHKKLASMKALRGSFSEVILFGSLARNTAVKSISDIDILVLFHMDPSQEDPRTTYEILNLALERIYKSQLIPHSVKGQLSKRVTLSSFCGSFLIDLQDTVLEIMPALYTHNKNQTILAPNISLTRWKPTNHQFHIQFTEEQNSVSGGLYSNIIKIAKWWQNYQSSGQGFVSGFVLECMIAANIKLEQEDTLLSTFEKTLRKIRLQYSDVARLEYVPEPGTTSIYRQSATYRQNPPKGSNRKATGLTTQSYLDFMQLIDRTLALTEKAKMANSTDNEVVIWQQIFGPEFPKTISMQE